jgi:hypothetical protein
VPNKRAFQLGKEYGNNGQCNPTYFTVGNLLQFVQHLEEKGLSKQESIDRYVFFTAGACGPCRFGMYEAEYRLAFRNASFDRFRALLSKQEGGLNQAELEAGLDLLASGVSKWNIPKVFKGHLNTQQKLALLTVAKTIFKREYNRLTVALGDLAYDLCD